MEIAAGSQISAPSPALAQPKPAPVVEYWDLNGVPNNTGIDHNAAHLSEFSELNSTPRRSFWAYLRLTLLTLLFSVAAYAAYLVWFEERDPIEEFSQIWEKLKSVFTEEITQPVTTVMETPVQGKKLHPKPAPHAAAGSKIDGNPYWDLPNRIDGSMPPLGRLWTPEEEDLLRAGMVHHFSYQRWRTVQDIRQKRLRGSEAVLWSAIQDKKFWTRAYAAIALAEMNIPISLPTLDGVLQDARSELITGFFERFTKSCNPAQCFVLRSALRLMDAPGRLVALRGIAASRDRYRQLYLAAATLDPDTNIQKWIKTYLSQHPLDPDYYNQLLQGIKDGSLNESKLRENIPTKPSKGRQKLSPKATAKGGHEREHVEDSDLEQQVDQLDDEVEIFEPETAMMDLASDPSV